MKRRHLFPFPLMILVVVFPPPQAPLMMCLRAALPKGRLVSTPRALFQVLPALGALLASSYRHRQILAFRISCRSLKSVTSGASVFGPRPFVEMQFLRLPNRFVYPVYRRAIFFWVRVSRALDALVVQYIGRAPLFIVRIIGWCALFSYRRYEACCEALLARLNSSLLTA